MKEEWIEIDKQLPNDNDACLCVKDGYIKILVFNEYFKCWDDEYGDNFYCAINDISHWMILPEKPKMISHV